MVIQKIPYPQFLTAGMIENFIRFRLIFYPFPLSTHATNFKFYIQ